MELDSRRVEHHRVLNCEASTAITAVSLDQWDSGASSAALQPAQRSAECCSWTNLKPSLIVRTDQELGVCVQGDLDQFGL